MGETFDNNSTPTIDQSIMQNSFPDLEYAAKKKLTRCDCLTQHLLGDHHNEIQIILHFPMRLRLGIGASNS
jgi:hypothetical protein